MLWAIIGDFGSGKTLFMVLVAISSKRDVLGNFSLNLDNYQKIDPIDLKEIGFNKLILLDELYLWLESRVSSSFLNRYLTHIVLQSRHRDIDVFGTMQVFSSVDVRFRLMVHRIVKCERVDSKKPYELRDFKYTVFNTYTGKEKAFILHYKIAEEYFPLYDSYEIIYPLDQDNIEREVMKYTPKMRYEMIEKLAKEISDNLEILTHDAIKLELLKKGINPEDHNLIYAHLKNIGKIKGVSGHK